MQLKRVSWKTDIEIAQENQMQPISVGRWEIVN